MTNRARTEGDSWDISESVGTTALAVAAARAVEAASEHPLVVDPYAQLFVDAAGQGSWSMYCTAQAQPMVDYLASRTAFFDEFFLAAAQAGVRQSVILAAGLDTRAWRLGWPAGMTVYELDQPRVLEFKASTLSGHGVQPAAAVVSVAVDLREDWPQALRDSGFDDDAPAAWSVEGLLPYLTAQGQDALFERIHSLSAPGSRVAVEALPPDFASPESREQIRAQTGRIRDLATASDHTDMPSPDDLFYFQDRADVADWLGTHGWEATAKTSEELMNHYQRDHPHGDNQPPRSVFITARHPGDDPASSASGLGWPGWGCKPAAAQDSPREDPKCG